MPPEPKGPHRRQGCALTRGRGGAGAAAVGASRAWGAQWLVGHAQVKGYGLGVGRKALCAPLPLTLGVERAGWAGSVQFAMAGGGVATEDDERVEQQGDDELNATLADAIAGIARCLHMRDFIGALAGIEGVFLDRLRLLADRQRDGAE